LITLLPLGQQNLTLPTGNVWIRDFDKGIVETMGAVVKLVTDPVTCEKKNNYYVSIPGVNPFEVPVIFGNPEQVFENKILPSIVVMRDSVELNLSRWHSVGQEEYYAGVTGGISGLPPGGIVTVNGVTGYSYLETKKQAWPYDFFYTISIYARFEYEALNMLKYILRKYQPHSSVKVIDSLNEVRYYDVYNESSISDISEIVDVADRTKAYSINLRVEGEIDLIDPEVHPTLSSLEFRMLTA